MKKYITAFVFLLSTAGAFAQGKPIYFSSGWCPNESEKSELSDLLRLEMNGCCIDRATPISEQFQLRQIAKYKDRLFTSHYPNSVCVGIPSSPEQQEEQNQAISAADAALAEQQRTADALAKKLWDERVWPPTNRMVCSNDTVLKRANSSYSPCTSLVRSEGQQTGATWSKEDGYFIADFGIWEVNSAGGVEIYAYIVNPKTSPIKYVKITAGIFNAVGDAVGSEIGGVHTKTMTLTGPVENEEGEVNVTWKPQWYNHTASCVKISSVSVQFINGSISTYSGKNLKRAFKRTLDNDCSFAAQKRK